MAFIHQIMYNIDVKIIYILNKLLKGVDTMNLNTIKKILLYLAYFALFYFAIKLLLSLFI